MSTMRDTTILSERRTPPPTDITCRGLAVQAESIDEETRTVEAVFATESPVTVIDWERYQLIDEVLLMSGVELRASVPMLDTHMRYSTSQVRGSGRKMRVEGATVVGRLHFADDEDSEKDWRKVKGRHITDVSVGYRVKNWVMIPKEQTQQVNGRTFKAGKRDLRVVTDWEIREISLTPIGADDLAKIRAEQTNTPPHGSRQNTNPHSQESRTMNPQLRRYLESLGLRTDASEQEAWAFLGQLEGERRGHADLVRSAPDTPFEKTIEKARAAASVTPPGNAASNPSGERGAPPVEPRSGDPSGNAANGANAAAVAERTRIRAIMHRGREHGIDQAVIDRCVDDPACDLGRASELFLENVRSRRQDPVNANAATGGSVSVGNDRTLERNEQLLAAGLMQRVSTSWVDPNLTAAERTERDELFRQGRRFQDMSLMDICRAALQFRGLEVPVGRHDLVRAATATGALTNIFTTSINARIMQGYMEAADTSDFAASEDVSNFQSNDRVIVDKMGSLDRHSRGGTANEATLGDDVETYRIARYSKKMTIDEMDFIDENLQVLTSIPMQLGMAAARLRPDLVYSILLANAALRDGVALFHTNHANTATNALNSTNLPVGVTAMGLQRQNDVILNIRPAFLIVNPTLEWMARELIQSAAIVLAGNTDVVRGNKNVLADLNLQIRVDNRLGAAGVIDPVSETLRTGSTTTWFLAAAPNMAPTIVVGYLAGTGRRPQVRSYVLDKGQWGLGWDIKHDIGAKALDFRPLYRGNT